MASKILYPAIVDDYMPAFKVGESSYCRLYFSLSKFNGASDFKTVHVVVTKQSSGENVVNKRVGYTHSTGIILNLYASKVDTEENLYYVDILNSDIKDGWTAGWIYKVQIRLANAVYNSAVQPAVWLKNTASEFSEWSTVCVIKATDIIDYTIPILNYNSADPGSENSDITTLFLSTLNISGNFTRRDLSENIKTYRLILYDNEDKILEDSSDLFQDNEQTKDSFNYTFKTELENNKTYKLSFKFETNNHYIDGKYWDDDTDNRFVFIASQIVIDELDFILVTVDNDPDSVLEGITSVHEEEEEGRIGLKLYSAEGEKYKGNVCVRRSDSKSNFKIWEDIKIIPLKDQYVNDVDIFYDYTVESGVWYKYGIQAIDKDGNRGVLTQIGKPVMRNFNYSFLLGENNQQLKLKFDNAMGNFRYQITESVTDTIGGKYPTATRNAATYYRTFPVNGLISFWMDENKLFCDKKIIYSYDDIVNLYHNYNVDNNIYQYDYIYEKDFRQKVLDFLYDGKLKLFKSPTEGNIIVRLTDINCTPNQSLDRMIYSFSANAYEMLEPTMENYFKNHFYTIGEIETDFNITEFKLGQVQVNIPVGRNLISEIISKYSRENYNIGGYSNIVTKIMGLRLIFEGPPLRVINSAGETIVGYNFKLNNKLFTVNSPFFEYDFDNKITFSPTDSLIILGDAEGKVTTVSVVADFLYELTREPYEGKEIQTRSIKTGIGQIYNNYEYNNNLYNEIYYKYYIESDRDYRRLEGITSIDIEANPGVLIAIKDRADGAPEIHEINTTGRLVLENLNNITSIVYKGTRDDINKSSNVLVDYKYIVTSGTYKQ